MVPTLNSRVPTYRIKVKTGDQFLAGTNSDVYVRIKGSVEGKTIESDELFLDNPYKNDFERVII